MMYIVGRLIVWLLSPPLLPKAEGGGDWLYLGAIIRCNFAPRRFGLNANVLVHELVVPALCEAQPGYSVEVATNWYS